MPKLRIEPQGIDCTVSEGANLMDALRDHQVFLDAPCGGNGKCGKCKVYINGTAALACETVVDRDMTVTIPQTSGLHILQSGIGVRQRIDPLKDGFLLAFDIGTTSVVCFLLDGKTGAELAKSSMLNPQTAFGADVISRIQAALRGELEQETKVIRDGMTSLIRKVCEIACIDPAQIGVVSVVGNPAMQQLFLGICPENLARLPFAPVLTEMREVPARDYLPCLQNAVLLVVPDISGFVGADTVACMLATGLGQQEDWTLLVDIGTNGEMVLGNKDRMVACSTAAGPALEGANISCGMRGQVGAIDHVRLVKGNMECTVIGGGKAVGICGSGLIDVAAEALELGLINFRGRVQTEDRNIPLTDGIVLTQDDIRQLQLAKGAIAAGIQLMAAHLGIELNTIRRVYLAGAFGTFMDPVSACRIGLLPKALEGKTVAVGNAAGSGAKLLACDENGAVTVAQLLEKTEYLELANLPDFQLCFAENMRF